MNSRSVVLVFAALLGWALVGCQPSYPSTGDTSSVAVNRSSSSLTHSDTDRAVDSNTHPDAVIIDQLASLQPNQVFLTRVQDLVEIRGWTLDLYQGEQVSVELYRRLPQLEPRLLVFRAHSGLLVGEEGPVRQTTLFTNEPYTKLKHVSAQLDERLVVGKMRENEQRVFAVNDKFVRESMGGEFDDTVVIMMGCSCFHLQDLAKAFVDKGASAYLAWHATVDLSYADRATLRLLEQLCTDNSTVAEAVRDTMTEVGPDPQYGAQLKYRPASAGDKTLGELIAPNL